MDISFNKILVCLDHTEKDRQLIENLNKFCEIAEPKEIIFFHVIKEFNLPEDMRQEFPDLFDKAIEERALSLKKIISELYTLSIETKFVIVQGSLTREILKIANDNKVDLIIQGRSITSKSVLNTRIARRSPCSLLIFPDNSRFKMEKIFVPIDFSYYSDLSLNIALELTKNSETDIYLQNVINVPSSYRYSGKSYKEFGEIIKGHLKKDLDRLIDKTKLQKQKIKTLLTLDKGESVFNIIWKEVRKNKIDLVIMGSRGRTAAVAIFIGSKAEKMIRTNYDIPLLIVRKKGESLGLIKALKETLD